MNRQALKSLVEKETKRRQDLMFGVRNLDYAKESDALSNFKERSHRQNRSAIHVCLSDMDKHIQQVYDHFCYGLPSKGQAIIERLDDIQNYIDLLRGLIKENENVK